MTNDTYPPREAKKLIPGSELHLTMLMASDSLNLVVGEDRAALLRFAQRVWDAAIAADRAERGEVVAWQWRRKGNPWTLEKTFNTEVFATTDDSEVRPLYSAPPSHAGDEALLRRAAELLEHYRSWIMANVMSAQIEEHPYVPEIEETAAALRERLGKEGPG